MFYNFLYNKFRKSITISSTLFFFKRLITNSCYSTSYAEIRVEISLGTKNISFETSLTYPYKFHNSKQDEYPSIFWVKLRRSQTNKQNSYMFTY